MSRRFYWKPEKNEKLRAERQVSFEEVEAAIAQGRVVDSYIYEGPRKIYQGQVVLVVELEDGRWHVPISSNPTLPIMRTIYPEEDDTNE